MLEAGVADRDITPDGPIWMDGYGSRDHPSEGVYAPLSARALALRQGESAAAVVVADVLNFDREQELRIKPRIGAAVGIPAEAVVLCATHTHCGPRVADLLLPGHRDAAYLERLEEALVDMAAEAFSRLQHARVSFSRTRSAFGISRRLPDGRGGVLFWANPEGVIERALDTWWVTTEGGQPLASVTVYGCHPTSRSGYLLGPDYPGYLRRGIERGWGGTALFLTGCGGNIRPAFLDADGQFRSAEVSEVEAAGEAMAAEALGRRARARLLERPALRVKSGTAMLPLEAPPAREALEAMAGLGPAAPDSDPIRRAWAGRILSRLAAGTLSDAVPFTIQTLFLDSQHALVFLAGEVVAEIGLAIKERYPYHVLSTPAYSNGLVGYVASRSMHPQGGYEVRGAHEFYVQPAPFTAEAEEAILAVVAEQIGE